jgi:photosystem II stability/assembly factor-like uncharacterized protein
MFLGPARAGSTEVTPVKLSPALALLLALTAAARADESTPRKPPLTKVDEAKKFHPRRAGMPPGPRLTGYERRLQMEKESLFQGLRFRSVGPEVQGGRIVDIDSPSAHPDALLVAFASGGLWRTDNRGGSWTPLFDQESTFTIGDFAIGDEDGQILYVGTGENNSSRSSYAGTGVFKTTDGGRTWRHLGLADSHHIGRVLVDPRDAQRVYVAALGHLYTDNDERGIYVSEDGGGTWTRTLYVDDRTGAVDLAQDPSDPSVLYAAMWEKARTARNFLESGPGSGLYKSTDRGRTWSRLAGGLPAGAELGRIGVEVAASRPKTVYVVLDNQAWRPENEPLDEDTPPGELTPKRLLGLGAEAFARLADAVVARYLRRYDYPRSLKAAALKRHVRAGRITIADLVDYVSDANRDLFERSIVGSEVYRSDDAGGTWRKTHEGHIEKVYYSYGYYFGRVHVDPSDPERVYFGGVPFLGSADGGKTWTGLDQRGVHVDHHALYIDPRAPNRVALGNDGGLNLSFDHGRTWTKVNNVPVGQFTTIAVDNAEPYNIMGGLQDNGVLRGPSTYVPGKSDPNAWRQVYGGDGSAVIADPKDPNVVYAAYQFGFASRLNLKTGERARVRPRPELTPEKKEKPLRYNWVTPIVLSPHSNNVVYYGANRLYRSFDRGDTWTAISDDLTTNPAEQGDVPFGTLTTISESPRRFGLLYVGTDDGKVWLTRDGGLNWIDVTAGLAPGKWVTRVVASAFDDATVYVTQNGYRDDEFTPYVWKSTDYGKTWQSIAAGLPSEPVNVLREDPKTKTLLYVGTDMGVFASLDGGATWRALAGGLPHVPVHDLAVHPRDGDLVLGTHGRSVYVAAAAPLRALTPEVMAKALHAFAPKTVTADPNRAYGDHPWITWPRQEVLVRLPFWSARPGPVTVAVKDAGGSVWKELKAAALAGLNEIEYDLSADARLAEAAEARAREKARAEQARVDAQKKKEPPRKEPEKTDTAVEDEEGGEPADTTASASGRPALDAELERILADPLRSTRRRYLVPGRYTLEMKAAGATATSTLTVKAPKEDAAGDDDEVTEDDDPDR